MALHYRDIVHPEDEKALRQLQNTAGVQILAEKIISIEAENLFYRQYLAEYIKIGPNQFSDIYDIFIPIVQKLGITEPEIFLTGGTEAFTMGDKKPIIVIGTSILCLPPEERDAVIAHECGHILCKHMLYKTVLRVLFMMLDPQKLMNVGLGGLAMFTGPVLQAAIYAANYWSRRSEYSADRVAALYSSPDALKRALLRLKYGSLVDALNFNEFVKQSEKIEIEKEESILGKIINSILVSSRTHPFDGIRVNEISLWGNSAQFRMAAEKLNNPQTTLQASVCPNCKRDIENNWKFCNHCGQKL